MCTRSTLLTQPHTFTPPVISPLLLEASVYSLMLNSCSSLSTKDHSCTITAPALYVCVHIHPPHTPTPSSTTTFSTTSLLRVSTRPSTTCSTLSPPPPSHQSLPPAHKRSNADRGSSELQQYTPCTPSPPLHTKPTSSASYPCPPIFPCRRTVPARQPSQQLLQ